MRMNMKPLIDYREPTSERFVWPNLLTPFLPLSYFRLRPALRVHVVRVVQGGHLSRPGLSQPGGARAAVHLLLRGPRGGEGAAGV